MAVLPDGRAVLPVRASSQLRLMAVQKGKDPAPLVNTTEETAAPVTACGSREIAFMIGPEPHETIAFAEPASGTDGAHALRLGKGPVDSISCSPDGKTVYFAARGIVWSIPPPAGPSAGSDARKIRPGDGVVADPIRPSPHCPGAGEPPTAPVQRAAGRWTASAKFRADSFLPVASLPLSPNALKADGRLLTPLLAARLLVQSSRRDRHRDRPHHAHSVRQLERLSVHRLDAGRTGDGSQDRLTGDAVEVSAGRRINQPRVCRRCRLMQASLCSL